MRSINKWLGLVKERVFLLELHRYIFFYIYASLIIIMHNFDLGSWRIIIKRKRKDDICLKSEQSSKFP